MDTTKQSTHAEPDRFKETTQAGSPLDGSSLTTTDFAGQMRDLLTVLLGSLEHLRRQSLDEHGLHQLARAEAAVERARELLNRYAPLIDLGRQDGQQADGSP